MLWHKLPKSIYFRRGSLPIALDEVITDGHKRALIVTDRFLFNNGYADQITSVLKASGVETEVFFEVEADPTLSVVRKGAELANSFKPDVIIALGGGSPMDAAKLCGSCTSIRKPTSKNWRCALWISVNVSTSSRKWA